MASHRLGFMAALVAMVTAAAFLVGGAGGAAVGDADRGQLPRIRGSVGPGFDISVRPRRIEPGTYRVVIQDQSSMHNWHIQGPGVDRKSGIAFVGIKRFTITVTAGTYDIQCDMHPTSMNTTLRVVT